MTAHENGAWIPLSVYCDRYSERANTVQKRVHDGTWKRGELYSNATGGQGFVHEERAKEWLKSKGKL